MEVIETASKTNEFIETKRIKVLVETFERKGYGAITDIIGTNCSIKKIDKLPIVIDNNYIIDVTFTRLSLNPLKFYVINLSEAKKFGTYLNDYYITIDKIPVKICLNIQADELKNKKKIMIQVNKTLTNEQVNRDYIKYYGTLVTNPLHDYISVLSKTYGYENDVRGISEIDKYHGSESPTYKDYTVEIFKDSEIEAEYKRFLSNTMYGKQYSDLQDIKEQSDIKSKSIAYRISALKVNKFPIYGIVFISKKRKHVFDVVIGINNNFSVSYEQWISILNFLNQEGDNYNTFLECLI